MRVGFIGLGQMGVGMAANLVAAGHEVTVYNRTASKAAPVVEQGARVAGSPGEAAAAAEAVMTMVADDDALEGVVFDGERGILAALPDGAVHVSHSTISVALAGRLTEAHRARGQGFVAAPVFGRPEAAVAARLVVVAAGDPTHLERCRPLFDAVGDRLTVVGDEPAAAAVVKIAGNFLIASVIECLGEAFALLDKSGVDAGQFLDLMTGSLFTSPVYENYGRMIIEERFDPAGFALRLGLKDVNLALDAGSGAGVPLPVASLMRDHLLQGLALGYGDLDWSALSRVIAGNAGLE